MYTKDLDIASLISSRICHDLVSPLGAISNGLELMELTGISRTPEFCLLSDSINNANARISFFRIAYGNATADAHLSADFIQQTLRDNYCGKPVRIDWQAVGSHPRPLVKFVCLLILCLETALPRGGLITIRQSAGSWQLQAQADDISQAVQTWAVLAGTLPEPSLKASEVQFELARCLAATLRADLNITSGDRVLSIEF
jgi:histidine phosphotransferase ChpT